jgi:uroporphyrinogen III methyltransferase/synthase
MTGRGCVYLIGAGPGDSGLVTARGVALIAAADVIVYDKAVTAALRWARPDAERIAAGAPAEERTAQDAISMLLAEKARDGHTVARLKWGDPYVFDSGGKEALFLHEQGIQFEVVPGVSPGLGIPGYAGVPVTYPGGGDVVILLRGHESGVDRLPDVDWPALARMQGTVVCYASPQLAGTILRALIDHGMPPDRTAALISRGSLPSQQTVAAPLRELADAAAAAERTEPALLVVGEVVRLRNHLRWFDERPLFGRRIIVTRSPDQARELVDALVGLGADAIEAPTFKLAPPDDPEAIERAAASIDTYQWIVFESATAVSQFLATLARGPRDLRAFGPVSICAGGPSTADRLVASGIKPDVVMPEVRAESVGDAIEAHGPIDGRRVLVVRPDHVYDAVPLDLARRGAAVTDLIAYRTTAESSDAPVVQEIYRQLLNGRVDAVTFTSPTAARRFASLVGEEQAGDLLRQTTVAAIGPVTAAAAAELGMPADVVAHTYTVQGLVEALVEHFKASPAGLQNAPATEGR